MLRHKTFILVLILCLAGGFYSYKKANRIFDKPNTNIVSEEEKKEEIGQALTQEAPKEELNVAEKELETEESVTASSEQKINPSTKIIYQYYFPEKNVTQEQEDSPPYFLLDLTLSDLVKYYDNWTVVSFSDKEVVLKKTVYENLNQDYIIGEKNGYVTVFYKTAESENDVYEITDTPVSSLSHAEQVRLNDGIEVIGEENLAKILEDYGS